MVMVIKMLVIMGIIHGALGMTSIVIANLTSDDAFYGKDGQILNQRLPSAEDIPTGGAEANILTRIKGILCAFDGVIRGFFGLLLLVNYTAFDDLDDLEGAWEWINPIIGFAGAILTMGVLYTIWKAIPAGLLNSPAGLVVGGLVGGIAGGWALGRILECDPAPVVNEETGLFLGQLLARVIGQGAGCV